MFNSPSDVPGKNIDDAGTMYSQCLEERFTGGVAVDDVDGDGKPDVYLTQFFHSDAIVVTGKNPNTNFAHYNKVDEQIESARREADPVRQTALWKEAQSHVLEDVVAYPIQYTNQVHGRATNVDYGHDLKSVIQLYPGIDERTSLRK